MSAPRIAELAGRGALRLAGPDAVQFLQGLVTNDVAGLGAGEARHCGLLSPQGKILFEFFAVRTPDGFVIDVAADQVAALAKRLGLYKLRANVAIADASSDFAVLALWGENAASPGETAGSIGFADPRHKGLGRRILAETRFAPDIAAATNGEAAPAAAYHAHRLALGVPEGGSDYTLGDTFPHEALFDQLGGVSFTKGCYVGQEIVSRMQHRGTARKRVVPLKGSAPLRAGAEVTAGGIEIGRVGSTADKRGLALVRLDRAREALDKGANLEAGGVPVVIDIPPWATFSLADDKPEALP